MRCTLTLVLPALALVAALIAAGPAQAAPIVVFGGDMVDADHFLADISNGPNSNFDDTAALSPASEYSGQTFYGGIWIEESHYNGLKLVDDGATDELYLDIWKNDSGAVILFKEADFLGGLVDADINANTSFSATTRNRIDYVAFVVQDSVGDYYVTPKAGKDVNGDWVLQGAGNWQPYDPASWVMPPNAAGVPMTFTDVQAVGLYLGYHSDAWSPDGYLTTFSVDADAVPEPATLLLLAFGGLGALLRRKRQAA